MSELSEFIYFCRIDSIHVSNLYRCSFIQRRRNSAGHVLWRGPSARSEPSGARSVTAFAEIQRRAERAGAGERSRAAGGGGRRRVSRAPTAPSRAASPPASGPPPHAAPARPLARRCRPAAAAAQVSGRVDRRAHVWPSRPAPAARTPISELCSRY